MLLGETLTTPSLTPPLSTGFSIARRQRMRGQPRAPANRPHRGRCRPHQLSPQPLSVVVSVMRADVVSHSHLVDEDGLYVAHVTLFKVWVSARRARALRPCR